MCHTLYEEASDEDIEKLEALADKCINVDDTDPDLANWICEYLQDKPKVETPYKIPKCFSRLDLHCETTEIERLRRKCLKAKEELAKLRNQVFLRMNIILMRKTWIWHVDKHDIVSARLYKPTAPHSDSWFVVDTLRRSDLVVFTPCDKDVGCLFDNTLALSELRKVRWRFSTDTFLVFRFVRVLSFDRSNLKAKCCHVGRLSRSCEALPQCNGA